MPVSKINAPALQPAVDVDPDGLLTPQEVANLLRVSRSTVHRLFKDGTLPYIRVRRRFFVDRASLSSWLAQGGGGL